ncbi:MAG: hypothetical protein IKS23_03975, partial [Alphaproteobacteria bacterium]|nr:hypothetical protein [Alphaproteobacteria bacterium]
MVILKRLFCICAILSGFVSGNAEAYLRPLSPENFNQLYHMASRGNVSGINNARSRGLNIDSVNSNGDTGLCVAAKKRDKTAFRSFLQAGANPSHPCTWEIGGFREFMNSVLRAPIQNIDTAVYGAKAGSSMSFTTKALIGAGVVAAAAGTAIALSSGGGGGGSKKSKGEGDKPKDECVKQGGTRTKPDDGYIYTRKDIDGNACYFDIRPRTCTSDYNQTSPCGAGYKQSTCVSGETTKYKCEPNDCSAYQYNSCDASQGYIEDGTCVPPGGGLKYKCKAAVCPSGYTQRSCDQSQGWLDDGEPCMSAGVAYYKCKANVCSAEYNKSSCDQSQGFIADGDPCMSAGVAYYKCKAVECDDDYNQTSPCDAGYKQSACISGGTTRYKCVPNDCSAYQDSSCDASKGWIIDGTCVPPGGGLKYKCKAATCSSEFNQISPCGAGYEQDTCWSGGNLKYRCTPSDCSDYPYDSCDEGYIEDGSCQTGTSIKYKCKVNPCTGYDYTSCPTGYHETDSCKSGETIKYKCSEETLDCVHGQWDSSQQKCVCDSNWAGELCSICMGVEDGDNCLQDMECEYGCKTRDSNGLCTQCNSREDINCEATPCNKGCYEDLECEYGCRSYNTCGGCQLCDTPSDSDFVIKSYNEAVENNENLTKTASSNKTWGGIYAQHQQVFNTGDVSLTGNGGVGIMSAPKDSIENTMNTAIHRGGGAVYNAGKITVNGDENYGLLSTTLGKIESGKLFYSQTMANAGVIDMTGDSNVGMALYGNGCMINEKGAEININGVVSKESHTSDSYFSSYFSIYLDRYRYNTGMYYNKNTKNTNLINLNTLLGSYTTGDAVNDVVINNGKITVKGKYAEEQSSQYYYHAGIKGIVVDWNPSKQEKAPDITNNGEINLYLEKVNGRYPTAIGILESNGSVSMGKIENNGTIKILGLDDAAETKLVAGIFMGRGTFNNYGKVEISVPLTAKGTGYSSRNVYALFMNSGGTANLYEGSELVSNRYAAHLSSGSVLNVYEGAVVRGDIEGNTSLGSSANSAQGTLNNYGTIYGNIANEGDFFNYTGISKFTNYGTISGGKVLSDTINNYGTINAMIRSYTVNNKSGATINGNIYGFGSFSYTPTRAVSVTNSGKIDGDINGISSLLNEAKGEIKGDLTGHPDYDSSVKNRGLIDGDVTAKTLVNTGTITGDVYIESLDNDGSIGGAINISSSAVTSNFASSYTLSDAIISNDTSALNINSQSVMFDASLNGNDVTLTKKAFSDIVENKSMAAFLEKNYALSNNEKFYNTLKSQENTKALNGAVKDLMGDGLKRFAFEDMMMFKELSFDMNEARLKNKEDHFTLTG